MTIALKLRSMLPAAAISFVALFLIDAEAKAAQTEPNLTSTPQYKSFANLVRELNGKYGQAATAAEKAGYEVQLTNKHRAAVNRATILFQRAKNAAKNETQRRFQAAASKVRKTEAAELADLRAAYADKLDAAADSFQRQLDVLEEDYDDRYVIVQRQIAELRMDKARANGLAAKDRIQAQVNTLIQQLANTRKQERKATNRLRERYQAKKKAIQAAKAAATSEIVEARQVAVEKLRKRWNRTYEAKVANLQAHRSSQLADLEAKLNRARAAIASMPVSG